MDKDVKLTLTGLGGVTVATVLFFFSWDNRIRLYSGGNIVINIHRDKTGT